MELTNYQFDTYPKIEKLKVEVLPLHFALPQPKSKKSVEGGRHEFFGDAILKFYVVKILLELFPEKRSSQLDKPVSKAVSNKNLSNFARFKNFKFGADGIEKLIAQFYLENPEKAISFIKEIMVFSGAIQKLG